MATQIVELTGDEASLLRSLDKVIQKQLEFERKLRDTGETGDAAGVAIEAAMAKVQRESDNALKGLLAELKTVGPAGQAASAALKDHLQSAGKAGMRSFDAMLEQLRLIDPEAAEAAQSAATALKQAGEDSQVVWREQLELLRKLGPEGAAAAEEIEINMRESGYAAGKAIEAAMEKVKRESDNALKGMLGDLKSFGPEGQAASEALKGHLVETGQAGFQSMEKILEQLRQIDPEAAAASEAAAAKIRDELGRAAQYTEGEFKDVLDELRSMGPTGKQAADQLRKSLVDAGQIAEKSMADIVAQLEKINPAAAKAGAAIVANVEKGDSVFKSFGASAVREVTAIAGAYVGVQEAVQLVNDYLTLQRDLIKEAHEAQIGLAKSQQDASKNLAALSPGERQSLLSQAPKIAQQSGFGDVKAITDALGTVASTGLNDPTKIAEIVRQTARLERLSPDNLSASASGAADVLAKTGLTDIRQALALVADTGAESLVGDPAKLAANLPKALAAGAATAPRQASEEAARQSAAIFAAATVVGDDAMGNSSATFTIDMLVRMEKFFANMSEEQVKARSKIELIDRKIEKGKDTESDRLKKGQLSDFLSSSEGVQDPGTQFGRLAILQKSETLASQFQGESGFGEKQFAPFLKGLLDGQSGIAANVAASFGRIGASTEKFEAIAKELESSTPQLSLATARAKSEGSSNAFSTADVESGMLEEVRRTVKDALKQSGRGFVDWATDGLQSVTSGLPGSSAAEETVSGVAKLLEQREKLQAGGVTLKESTQIARIDQGIETLLQVLLGTGSDLSPESRIAAASRAAAGMRRNSEDGPAAMAIPVPQQNLEVFERILKTLEAIENTNSRTAANTEPKATAVTPALSSQQP